MKRIAVMIASLCLATTSGAQGDDTERGRKPMQTVNDSKMVAPALEKYAQGPLAELWKRPGLTPRDRSIVTIAALVGRNQTIEMPYYFNLALDNGVKPREISEIITHLAFYSGWANAMSAVAVAKEVFAERKIGADQLPPASPALLPLDEDAEVKRATAVEQQFGKVAPGIAAPSPGDTESFGLPTAQRQVTAGGVDGSAAARGGRSSSRCGTGIHRTKP